MSTIVIGYSIRILPFVDIDYSNEITIVDSRKLIAPIARKPPPIDILKPSPVEYSGK